MRLIFLDDDPAVLDEGLAELDSSRFDAEKYSTIEEAQSALSLPDGGVVADDVMCFVDHDLGAGRVGYTFVAWLRRNHPKGLRLPIVYLTGRESERGFLEQQAKDPYHTPSLYLSKREAARSSFDLNAFIDRLADSYSRAAQEDDEQRMKETLNFFEAFPEGLTDDR